MNPLGQSEWKQQITLAISFANTSQCSLSSGGEEIVIAHILN